MIPGRGALLAALACVACRGAPLPAFEVTRDEAAHRALVADLLPARPAGSMVQRWLLDARGTEFVFTLYVRLEPPDSMAIAALSDLGGTLASATWAAGAIAVDPPSTAFPAEHILRALAPVYLPGPAGEHEVVRLADATLGLRRDRDDEETLRWRDAAGRVHVVAGERGRVRSAATVHGPSLYLEGPGFEAMIDVVNR
jgi:hypothetical protein